MSGQEWHPINYGLFSNFQELIFNVPHFPPTADGPQSYSSVFQSQEEMSGVFEREAVRASPSELLI